MLNNSDYRVHGDERELTVMARDNYGESVAPALLVRAMLSELRASPSVPSSKEADGLFVTHGHVYPELQRLLEAASADCRTPREAVRQSALLRRLIANAAERVQKRLSLSEFVLSQHNTAYSIDNIDQSTAGHFNITRFAPLPELMPDLGTFMCAMPLLSGGGGIAMRSFDFTISIRADRCHFVTSGHTQSKRGVVDAKDIPAPHGCRQQLLGIDNLQSHRQARAVYAAINLFLCCIESNLDNALRLELANPIADMRRAITGPDLSYMFRLVNGKTMTGAQILLTYMEWIQSHLYDTEMPEWADAELRQSMEIVVALNDAGMEAVEGICDYATLFRIWRIALSSHNLTCEEARLAAKVLVLSGDPTAVWKSVTESKSNRGRGGFPPIRRMSADIVRRYFAALQQFMAIAYEFGNIMRGGLFDQLCIGGLAAPGVLFENHELDAALNSPPPIEEGRCHARAKAILELDREGMSAGANWEEIHSAKRGVLDLQDVTTTNGEWKPAAITCKTFPPNRHPLQSLREYARMRESEELNRSGISTSQAANPVT